VYADPAEEVLAGIVPQTTTGPANWRRRRQHQLCPTGLGTAWGGRLPFLTEKVLEGPNFSFAGLQPGEGSPAAAIFAITMWLAAGQGQNAELAYRS